MSSDRGASLGDRIFQAAWMSIAIGIVVEIALVAAAATFGKASNLRPFIADLAGKVSWSMIVCVGITIGTVAATARGPVMGFLGALSAPAGFAVAKAIHKSVAQGLEVAIAATASGPTAGQMMFIRGVEYALLGLAVGQISQKVGRRLPLYALLGLGVGLAAGALVLSVTVRTSPTPPPPLALISKGINEVLFPVGCSMVLYAANTLGTRMKIAVAA